MSLKKVRVPPFSRGPEPPLDHPLVRAAVARLHDPGARPVLLLGIGSGRHVAPLLATGARLIAFDADPARAATARATFAHAERFEARSGGNAELAALPDLAAVVSTHALLHGTPVTIAATLAILLDRLAPDGDAFATIGSQADPRYGTGTRVAVDAFAPLAGPEAGVAHAYFDERGVWRLFAGFARVDARETAAGEHVGTWAHGSDVASIVHWFVHASAA